MAKYIVKRFFSDGKELFLHPQLGFCCEQCNGGVYVFNSKSAAVKARRMSDKYFGIPQNATKTELLTYEEYITQRDTKLKKMCNILMEKGIETHMENHRLYAYASAQQFGKTVAAWKDLTLYEIGYVKKI